MSFFVFVDRIDSQSGTFSEEADGERRTIKLLAFPVGTPASIGFLRIEAAGALPSTYDGLWLQSINADANNDGTYNVTGNYGPRPPRNEQYSTYQVQSSGETENVKKSLSTVDSYKAGGGAADTETAGALGWDGSEPQGIDIPVPGMNWIETHYLPQALVTREWIGFLIKSRSKVNNATWKGFAAGECQFLEFSSSANRQDADSEEYTWTCTFTFAARPNQTGIVISPDIAPFSKDGMDRLEIRFAKVATVGGFVWPKPHSVYIERVFERMDFAEFGIGE